MYNIKLQYFGFMWKNGLKTCLSSCALLFWKVTPVTEISYYSTFFSDNIIYKLFTCFWCFSPILYQQWYIHHPPNEHALSTSRHLVSQMRRLEKFSKFIEPLSTASTTGTLKSRISIMWNPNLVAPANLPPVMFMLLPECWQALKHMMLPTSKGSTSPM